MKKRIFAVALCAALCIGSVVGLLSQTKEKDTQVVAIATTNTIITPMVDDPPGF